MARQRDRLLLRMCLILAIVEVDFQSTTPRRSVYGDQGQEVAWEVGKESFIAKRDQVGSKEKEVDGSVGRQRLEQLSQRRLTSFERGSEWTFEQQLEAKRRQQGFLS
jgi:hypothetical protein